MLCLQSNMDFPANTFTGKQTHCDKITVLLSIQLGSLQPPTQLQLWSCQHKLDCSFVSLFFVGILFLFYFIFLDNLRSAQHLPPFFYHVFLL